MPASAQRSRTYSLASIAGAWLVAAILAATSLSAAEDEIVVLTALPVTYSIAMALAEGTDIRVTNVPDRGRRMTALSDLLERRADRFASSFAEADAVITIGKLWREDPLYTAARTVNIRVVDIDATKPWSTSLEGIAVTMQPEPGPPWAPQESADEGRRPSIYAWLSPVNGARMADIVASDLMRLSPPDAARIERNLAALRGVLLDLKLDYELRFAELADLSVFALADEFVYLTNDLSLYVDGYFVKQDIDWTPTDFERFEDYLSNRGIGVVIHKWEPAEPIVAAIEAAGARLVVLDAIDSGIVEDGRLAPHSYTMLLAANLEALYRALAADENFGD